MVCVHTHTIEADGMGHTSRVLGFRTGRIPPDSIRVEPQLKPYQPNHRIIAPRDMSCSQRNSTSQRPSQRLPRTFRD
eukprot:2228795-Rhodomonas_salina.2